MPVYKCPEGDSKSYKCSYCSKPFKSRQSKYQHHKFCLHKPDVKPKPESKDLSEIDKLKQQLQEKDEILKEREKVIENLKSSKLINIEQMNVYINAFGEEKMDYITNNKMKEMLKNGPINAISNLLKEIHFNPDHHENHNIYIPNKKHNLARIYDGKQWIYKKKREAIENLTDKALNILSDKNTKIENINDKYYNGDKKTIDRIHSDTEIVLLNESKKFVK